MIRCLNKIKESQPQETQHIIIIIVVFFCSFSFVHGQWITTLCVIWYLIHGTHFPWGYVRQSCIYSFLVYNAIAGLSYMVVLYFKSNWVHRYRYFHIEKKEYTGLISSCLSSLYNGYALVGWDNMVSRRIMWAVCIHCFPYDMIILLYSILPLHDQFICSCCDVYVLFSEWIWWSFKEVSLVEKISHNTATSESSVLFLHYAWWIINDHNIEWLQNSFIILHSFLCRYNLFCWWPTYYMVWLWTVSLTSVQF